MGGFGARFRAAKEECSWSTRKLFARLWMPACPQPVMAADAFLTCLLRTVPLMWRCFVLSVTTPWCSTGLIHGLRVLRAARVCVFSFRMTQLLTLQPESVGSDDIRTLEPF